MRTIPGLAAATLCLAVLGSCADDAPVSEEADYEVLVDNDTDDTDMILGEPGAYAMTARGSGKPPYAVIHVPAGYANFGSFAVWPQPNENDDTRRAAPIELHSSSCHLENTKKELKGRGDAEARKFNCESDVARGARSRKTPRPRASAANRLCPPSCPSPFVPPVIFVP